MPRTNKTASNASYLDAGESPYVGTSGLDGVTSRICEDLPRRARKYHKGYRVPLSSFVELGHYLTLSRYHRVSTFKPC